ncbi:MAG TPA: hypothetical protein VFL83_14420 [Anaeromyxobacter sp.]|nr:hypothetical protein [Anaeromyxobacter sp.]
MASWERTADGWAVNLDGTNAAREFTLPRIELHSGPRGWTCVCHLEGGTSRALSIGAPAGAVEAKRAAVESALAALDERHAPALRALL